MGYKIEITSHASQDLDEIITYIASELKNSIAATALLDAISDCYEGLAVMPFLYELCRDPHLKARNYRRAIIKHYVMIYRVDETTKTVYILRFF